MSFSSKKPVNLEVPWPPSDNSHKKGGRLTRTKTGILYQPRVNTLETKRYFYEVWLKIRTLGLKSFGSATIYVEVDAYPPDERKRDITNILKVLCDSLQRGGLFDDDYQICKLLIQRMPIYSGGKVVVRLRELK
jgi:crossover junction endodeoxyribonuclease RusA